MKDNLRKDILLLSEENPGEFLRLVAKSFYWGTIDEVETDKGSGRIMILVSEGVEAMVDGLMSLSLKLLGEEEQ